MRPCISVCMPHLPAESFTLTLYLVVAFSFSFFEPHSSADPKYPLRTAPVQPLPHGEGSYQPYSPPHRQPYDDDDQGGGEEEEAYYDGYHSQYYPQQPSQFIYRQSGYYPGNSEDVELRSPGVVRFSQTVVMEDKVRGRADSP